MTQRLAHAEFEPMSRSGSWRVRLIGLLMTGILFLSVAALLPLLAGLPAHAQTPWLSDADKADQEKREKRNEKKIQRLKYEQQKLDAEIVELVSDSLKPDLKPAEKQKLIEK